MGYTVGETDQVARLTVAKVRAITQRGMHGDGGTLYLCVAPGGSRNWIQRVTIAGKRCDIGLGGFPLVSLAEARERAFENRKLARAGGDPLAAKRRAKVPTFRDAARQTFDANRPRWRNAKVAANWMQQMERHAFPRIGDRPVDQIGRDEILRILTPIWTSRPETARKVRQRIRATLSWAQAHGFIEHNVAGEAISGALPAMPAVAEHFRALPFREVPAALEAVYASAASQSAKLCFRFTILAAARSGETRGATWDEINMDAADWRIPASRMKAGTEHRVPLSDPALAVLEQARPLRDKSGLVFPSPSRAGRPLSDMTLTKLLRSVGLAERATVHGFRSAFRDWAAECTNAPNTVMELSLAHAVGSSVEQAYARSDLIEKRRALMRRWAYFVTGTGADVTRHHG